MGLPDRRCLPQAPKPFNDQNNNNHYNNIIKQYCNNIIITAFANRTRLSVNRCGDVRFAVVAHERGYGRGLVVYHRAVFSAPDVAATTDSDTATATSTAIKIAASVASVPAAALRVALPFGLEQRRPIADDNGPVGFRPDRQLVPRDLSDRSDRLVTDLRAHTEQTIKWWVFFLVKGQII